MYPYITCTCGRSLGDLYDAFKVMRKKKIAAIAAEKNPSIKPNMMIVGQDLQIDLNDDLNALGLKMDCCRMRMMSLVEFRELY